MPLPLIMGLASLAGTGYSIYAGAKADKYSKKAVKEQLRLMGLAEDAVEAAAEAYAGRWEKLKAAYGERIDYRPITDEEIDLYTDLVNAKAEESMAETRIIAAEKAGAAGYDPQEVLGRLEPEIQKERNRLITQSVLQLKATDMMSERQFLMQEDLRLAQGQISLYSMPSPEEVKQGELAAIYSGRSQYARGTAEMYGARAQRYVGLAGEFAGMAGYYAEDVFKPKITEAEDVFKPKITENVFKTPRLTEVRGGLTVDRYRDLVERGRMGPFYRPGPRKEY